MEYKAPTPTPSPVDVVLSTGEGVGVGAAPRYHLHDLARLFADARLSADERTAAQHRHAEHYADVLQTANSLLLQGGNSLLRGLNLFDAELVNIRIGQDWSSRMGG